MTAPEVPRQMKMANHPLGSLVWSIHQVKCVAGREIRDDSTLEENRGTYN